MRGQLTGLWRAADGQPLSWRNPQRFSWSVGEPGVPTGVTAGPWGCQPPLPRTLHAGACVSLTTTSACFKEGGIEGRPHCFCPEQLKGPRLLGVFSWVPLKFKQLF